MSMNSLLENQCPACHHNGFDHIDSVTTQALAKGYLLPHLGIDISAFLPSQMERIDLLECRACGLRWYWPMIPGDAGFYEQLQRNEWYYQTGKPEHAYAATKVASNQRLLEIGCGAGAFAACLPPSVSYSGLEFNDSAVRRAVAAGLDVKHQSVDEEAATRPGSYDVVCHFQVLEHVSDVSGFMRACVAALKPGGQLMVTVPSEDSFLSIAGASWLNMPPHHVTRWTDRALTNLLTSLGVETESIWHEPVASFHAEWYSAVLISYAVGRMLGVRPSLRGDGLAGALAYRAGRVPALRRWLVARGESAFPFSGRGHSVCVIGRRGPA